jgi:hypothetical protein
MKKYHTTFAFVETEDKAKQLCAHIDEGHTPYIRKAHPSTYAHWCALDGSQPCFCVKYVY